jgi:hypothetical protein
MYYKFIGSLQWLVSSWRQSAWRFFEPHNTCEWESFLRALTFGQSRKKRWMRDSILHCGCVEKLAYFHGVYRYEGNPLTRIWYGTHDGCGVWRCLRATNPMSPCRLVCLSWFVAIFCWRMRQRSEGTSSLSVPTFSPYLPRSEFIRCVAYAFTRGWLDWPLTVVYDLSVVLSGVIQHVGSL